MNKPRLKLKLNGHIEVLVSVESGLNAEALRLLMKRLSGSVSRYCASMHLDYESVIKVLNWPNGHEAGRLGYTRALLGLPVRPSRQALRVAFYKRGDTRLNRLLDRSPEVRS